MKFSLPVFSCFRRKKVRFVLLAAVSLAAVSADLFLSSALFGPGFFLFQNDHLKQHG